MGQSGNGAMWINSPRYPTLITHYDLLFTFHALRRNCSVLRLLYCLQELNHPLQDHLGRFDLAH